MRKALVCMLAAVAMLALFVGESLADPPRMAAKRTPTMAMVPTPMVFETIEQPSELEAVPISISNDAPKQSATCACGDACQCATIQQPKDAHASPQPPPKASVVRYANLSEEEPTYRPRGLRALFSRGSTRGTCSGGGCQ